MSRQLDTELTVLLSSTIKPGSYYFKNNTAYYKQGDTEIPPFLIPEYSTKGLYSPMLDLQMRKRGWVLVLVYQEDNGLYNATYRNGNIVATSSDPEIPMAIARAAYRALSGTDIHAPGCPFFRFKPMYLRRLYESVPPKRNCGTCIHNVGENLCAKQKEKDALFEGWGNK